MSFIPPNVHPQTRLCVQAEPSIAPTDSTLMLKKYFELIETRYGKTLTETEVLRLLSMTLPTGERFLSNHPLVAPLQILTDQYLWVLTKNEGAMNQLPKYCKSLNVQCRLYSDHGKYICIGEEREWTQFLIDYQGLFHPKRFLLLCVALLSQLLQDGVQFISHSSLSLTTHRVRHLLDVERQQLIRQKYFEINRF